MTTIIIKKENGSFDQLLQNLGYDLKRDGWNKEVDLSHIKEEIEKLLILNIHSIEILLD